MNRPPSTREQFTWMGVVTIIFLLALVSTCHARNWAIFEPRPGVGQQGHALADDDDATGSTFTKYDAGTIGFLTGAGFPIPDNFDPGLPVSHIRFFLRGRNSPHEIIDVGLNAGWDGATVEWTFPGLPRFRNITPWGNDGEWQQGWTPNYTTSNGVEAWRWSTLNGSDYGAMAIAMLGQATVTQAAPFFSTTISEFRLEVWCPDATCPPGSVVPCVDYDDDHHGGGPCPGCGELSRAGDDSELWPARRASTWGALKVRYK